MLQHVVRTHMLLEMAQNKEVQRIPLNLCQQVHKEKNVCHQCEVIAEFVD
jgi:hypothetical protein